MVFSYNMAGRSAEALPRMASLCIRYHNEAIPHRRASDNRQDFLSINRNLWVFKSYYFPPKIQPMTAPITAERVSPAALLRTLIMVSPEVGAF